ncbi:MAG: peptidase [Paludisphaera borealis]|uniref:peptidase n=1 Tax=Paludisphaera borealis TaxID=1387353 RepID=UPI002851293D|nr:peptidase [Paludisphaera borealis]MDR3622092.1 peptidase [Paludisphaera borealis]
MPSSRPPLLRSSLLALTMALATALPALASTPSLTAVRPVGGQRGVELDVTFSGARLGDAKEILFYQPGVTATAITKVDDNNVKAKVKIAADSPLGWHDLRVRTATGLSELRGFSVGAFPEVAEAEPNNDFAAPQAIPMNVTINGVADNEDVDYFVVDAKKGERISVEVEGMRLGITLFDPYVAILNTKRFELASSDDAALLWQDAFASVVAPEDGKYIIQVRESAYAGNGACLYRVQVGNYPRSTGVFPPGGKFGETLAVRWIGDPAGEATVNVTLPAAYVPNFGITRQDEKGLSPHPNLFRLTPLGNVLEKEPNNDQATATPFTAPMALNGVLEKAGDVDHFVFAGKKGQTYDFRLFGRQLRSPIDSVMYLAKKGAGAAVGNDDAVGPDSYFRFACPEDAEYVVSVVDQLGNGGPAYVYRIEVSPVAPKLTVTTPAEQIMLGTGVMAPSVPRGNRQAILIQGSRADFGGDVNILAENLPPGIEMEAPVLVASQAIVPVLFKAKADAPLAATLAKISGKSVDPKVEVASEFSSQAAFVLSPVNNGIIVWSRTVDRLAVGVTEESPYSIEIVQPKVPMVRSGQMGLKVRATRKEGFKAAIAVSLPWNPPGVGSSGGVAIPEGQNEAVIPMNADGGAELRTWKIVVNGTSSGPTGPIMVSSQLADLTIAAPFVGLTFQAATVEQGKEADMAVAVAKNVDFPGEADVSLVGLPNKVTTDVKKITKDSKDIVYHLKTDATSPAGNHTNLFCQVVVTQNGEPIVHNIGSGTLRIDAPLPKPAAAAAPAPAAAPVAAAAPAAAPAKPLSRLEKLRLDSKQKQQAAAAGK